jgi:hypothetical protein
LIPAHRFLNTCSLPTHAQVVDGAVLRWFAANMPLEDIAFQLRTGSGLRLHLVHEASGQDVQALGEEQLLQLETLSLDWW